MQRVVRGPVLFVILLAWGIGESPAQVRDEHLSSQPQFCAASLQRSFDQRGLALVYCDPPTGVARSLEAAHATARPAFYGSVPTAWMGAALTQEPSLAGAAYRLTLTQGVAYGLIVGVKRIVGRSRPYVDLALEARTDRHKPPEPGDAHLSFPSGHSGLSAALATSWSLSYPRWYVIAPGAVWAAGVSLSRLYLGVHYASDVLVGAVLGAGVAVLVHHLRRSLTPPVFRGHNGPKAMSGLPLVLHVRF